MKYWLTTESQLRKLKADKRRSGLAAVVSDDFAFLIRVENLSYDWNITPWIRRRDSVAVDVLHKHQDATINQLSASEMRKFISAARQGPAGEPVEIRVHALSDRYVVHAALRDRIASRVVPASGGELRAVLTRFKLKYRNFRITLIGADIRELNQIFEYNLGAGIVFEFERLCELRPRRDRALREVLVLTNISGTHLNELEKDLAFWSKGVVGFRFRHVFGQLTQKRIEGVLALKEWDCLIYRGHGAIIDGAISWNLEDGPWTLPPFSCSLYLHLSCLANPQDLRLDRLPTARLVTPLKLLEDFDDARMIRLFMERYKVTGSLISSIRSVQSSFPQFACISSGD